MSEFVCFSEIEAWKLLNQSALLSTSFDTDDYHKAGNEIILLAEKIKAERIVALMKELDGNHIKNR